MLQRRLGQPEHRVDVRFHRRVEVFRADIGDRLRLLLPPGIIDKRVDAAQRCDSVLDQCLTKGLVAKISGQRHAFAAFLLDQGDNFPGVRLLVREIVDRDICTLARKCDRGSTAHAGIAARDQCLAARKAARSDIRGLTVIRLGMHLASKAREWLGLLVKGRLRIGRGRIDGHCNLREAIGIRVVKRRARR